MNDHPEFGMLHGQPYDRHAERERLLQMLHGDNYRPPEPAPSILDTCNFEQATVTICPECDCGTKLENVTFTITGSPKYLDLPPIECEIPGPCGGTRKASIPWDNERQCWRGHVGENIVSVWEVPECCQDPIYVCPTTTTNPATP